MRQDHALSVHWFQQAALQGDADAQFNLGRIYGKATGPVYQNQRAAPRNDVIAASWYRKAAEQNYVPAQFNLGHMYAEGSQSFPQDFAQAYFWTHLAVTGSDRNAFVPSKNIENLMSTTDKYHAEQLASEWKQRHSN